MTDVLDPAASMIEAAQKAAADGDFPAAERLLRDAAAMQEATLGSDHPDLATTLNNLALVCERTNNIAEAERGYRRAHAIAVASLGPRHPFVATSVRNLVDFCAAHEIPIWTPPVQSGAAATAPSPAATAQPEVTPPAVTPAEAKAKATAEVSAEPSAEFDSEFDPEIHSDIDSEIDSEIDPEMDSVPEDWEEPMPVTAWRTPRTIALAALGVAVIAAVVFTMRSRETASPVASPPPSPTAPAVTQSAQPTVAVETKPDAAPARIERPDPPEPRDTRDRSVTPQPVTVLNAELCSALVKRGSPDWLCASAKGDLQPGRYIFYTRLLTNANTRVEHRWYRNGRVHQVMRLRVPANASNGFRTFSSNTISPERAGDWKVEVRAADGTLLQEEHFVVH